MTKDKAKLHESNITLNNTSEREDSIRTQPLSQATKGGKPTLKRQTTRAGSTLLQRISSSQNKDLPLSGNGQ